MFVYLVSRNPCTTSNFEYEVKTGPQFATVQLLGGFCGEQVGLTTVCLKADGPEADLSKG